jgi:hypothetical protein
VIELADTIAVQTNDFAIENRVIDIQIGKRLTQEKKLEVICVARNQLTFAIFYIGDCTESVVFQFEDEVEVIEWL